MAYLTLEDGTVYEGESFGAATDVVGEVVFNTGMTGYQEVLTDPSYSGQLVTMTYPLIGNYGVNFGDPESDAPKVTAMIVRELCDSPNNWRSEGTLGEYMKENNICGLMGIDTRALTRRIRNFGTMRGIITQEKPTEAQLAEMRAFTWTKPVDRVTCKESYLMGEGDLRVAVLDFGLKRNILRSLAARGIALTVFPAHTKPEDILGKGFHGIMLTNGPGDPKDNGEIIENVKILLERAGIPIFGICLGHQLLALAMGADAEKLKYGHRGSNHPVKDLKKDRVYITSQNHGYAIVEKSLPKNAEVTHISMNDGTIEGLRYTDRPVFSVQFHPEASPGPEDTAYLFDEFVALMKAGE